MIRPIQSENEFVAVTDGSELVQISPADLPHAEADGFYRPVDRGFTVVSNGTNVFEIPLSQVKAAVASGYQDLLSSEQRLLNPAALNSAALNSAALNSASLNSASMNPASMNPASGQARPAAQETVGNTAGDVQPIMIAELSQLESAVDQEREQREAELAETSGWRRSLLALRFWLDERRVSLMRQFGSGGISVLIHVAILLVLASFVLVNEKPKDILITATSRATEEVVEDVIMDATPVDVTEPTEETKSEAPPEAEEVTLDIPVTKPNFMGAVSGAAVKPPAKPSKFPGKDGDDKPSKKPTFFGSKFSAVNYVFVIDNSNSMTRGRFETAIYELMLTVNRLTPKQRFYVIFYSDTAYPMMHPNAVLKLVPATNANKAALWQWLLTVQLCLKTNGKEALQAAFSLEPDVIYVLGDGAFTDGAGRHFAARPHPRIIVHTRGMEVSAKNAVAFRKLAEANRGTYMDVGVNPEGALMAQRTPVRRNNTRGPVWGVTLPVAKQ